VIRTDPDQVRGKRRRRRERMVWERRDGEWERNRKEELSVSIIASTLMKNRWFVSDIVESMVGKMRDENG